MAIAWRTGASIFLEEERLILAAFSSHALALTSHYAEEDGVGSMGLASSTTKESNFVTGARRQRMLTHWRRDGRCDPSKSRQELPR